MQRQMKTYFFDYAKAYPIKNHTESAFKNSIIFLLTYLTVICNCHCRKTYFTDI